MSHEVEIKIDPTRKNDLFKCYGVFFLGTDICVAQHFICISEAEEWIRNYNIKRKKEVLKLV